MASHHAHLSCVLKVNQRCDACKRHAMEVLGSLDGVYHVEFDAERKTASIMGEVNPNYCIKALARCGIHAELIRASLTHPRLAPPRSNRGFYDHNDYYDHSHNRNYYYGGDPYASSYPRSLPEGMWHEGYNHQYPVRSALPEYSYNSNYYYGGAPHAQSLSYPRGSEYYPYVDDQYGNSCRIM